MSPIPKPDSKMLAAAIIGGAGLAAPPESVPPEGMAVVLLYVPIEYVVGKSPVDIQGDLGLPWLMNNSEKFWFEKPSA